MEEVGVPCHLWMRSQQRIVLRSANIPRRDLVSYNIHECFQNISVAMVPEFYFR